MQSAAPTESSPHGPPAVALTKITPPRLRPRLVPRPALEQALAHGLDTARLVLLCAPAGFGKTTALARQLALLPPGSAVAWVSADRGDDLASLQAALHAALAPLFATALDHPAAAWALANSLAAAPVPRGVLVIDDAHRIADPAAFAWLGGLLDSLPPHWSLLMTSRETPPLSLARLRALGELAELGPAELRFSPAESADLARTRGAALAPEALHALHEHTQGWPAGLSLALGGPPGERARQRVMVDYLESEVLAGLPASLRDFLLHCAALDEWRSTDCAAVTGRADAARCLDDLERRGLFVTLAGHDDTGAPVLRPHPVFRDALRAMAWREDPTRWPVPQPQALPQAWSGTTRAPAPPALPLAPCTPSVAPIAAPGSHAMQPPAASSAASLAAPPAASPGCTLSTRELEVLARIASGDSNKLIARAFDLSPHTVKRHVANILDKLLLTSRVQAAAWHQAHQAAAGHPAPRAAAAHPVLRTNVEQRPQHAAARRPVPPTAFHDRVAAGASTARSGRHEMA